MSSNQKLSEQEKIVKECLSENLGIENDDVSLDDDLKEDLHMSIIEISDFLQKLKDKGLNINPSAAADIQTISDILDLLSENEL